MERRRNQRTCLRLRLLRLGNCTVTDEDTPGIGDVFWTENVSARGLYVRVPEADVPACGERLNIDLSVPEGQRCAPQPCHLRGTGAVLRQEPRSDGTVGLAIQFSRHLDVMFTANDDDDGRTSQDERLASL